MTEKFAWYVARSSGIVAWALVSASVMWGLLLASGLLRRPKRGWYLDLHRFLGGLAVVFTAVHLAALYADAFIGFGLVDLFVPLASKWRPVPVAYGVNALYLLLAVEGTSLALPRVPRSVWRWVHLSSFLLYVLATVHMLAAGSDVAVLRWAAAGSVTVIALLSAARLFANIPEPQAPPPRARRTAPATASAAAGEELG